ncbi:DUF3955 domain-containing protein [Pukyongiella litopenaei]|uniref:DUF3955 domain-containing protein n=2 Tax=Pukyongiella litopenaei TaxID=2605946 RepID=A0A2S0MPM8_9RHOB|nr:DUF3955 domain-containing protein [Pukyongiella litopenaei]
MLLFLAIGLAGLACALLYSAIGATVDDQGILREPFFLIPLGFALTILGAAGTLTTGLIGLARGAFA